MGVALKEEPAQLRSKSRESSQFHRMAWPFLSGLGFQLVYDPSVIRSPRCMTQVIYRSQRGFYVLVGFDPADGNYAVATCGRLWRREGGWLCLSNNYSELAKRLGFDVPAIYRLGYGREIPATMKRILGDLGKTLPSILQKVTLEDLTGIEHERFGAEEIAIAHFGSGFLPHVEISAFPDDHEIPGATWLG